ncbi:MAG: hypothetical protein KJ957_01235 [Candidatus Omnitrophica bacterium]|nr:hypothetical protein [Candidatus Omnitrophota bacterium]
MPKKKEPIREYDSGRETRVLFEKIETEIKLIGEQHSSVIRKLEEHDGRFDKIEADQYYMKVAIKELDGKVDKIDGRVDRVENKLDSVENRLDRVENRLDRVENRLDHVDNSLDKMDHKLDTALVNHGERITKLEHRTT